MTCNTARVAAPCTVIALGGATIGAVTVAVISTSVAATVAFGVLAYLGAALSTAALVAWVGSERGDNASQYFTDFAEAANWVVPLYVYGAAQFAIKVLAEACRAVAIELCMQKCVGGRSSRVMVL